MKKVEKRKTQRSNLHGKYEYTKLGDIDVKSPYYGKTYIYAYVLDASVPFKLSKKDGNSQFMVSLKIADDSYNPICSNEAHKNSIKAFFYDTQIETLPHITEVGTIIRIHRASPRIYNNKLSLNCDLAKVGSWSTYQLNPCSTINAYSPLKYSKNSYSWVDEDKKRLDNIRIACRDFLKNCQMFEFSVTLTDATKRKYDFDVLGLVLKVSPKKNEKNILNVYLCDNEKIVTIELTVEKNNVFHLEGGKFIRIRSAHYEEGSTTQLKLTPYTNILTIPEESKTSQELLKRIRQSKKSEILLNYKIYISYLESYILGKTESNKNAKPVELQLLTSDNKAYPIGKIFPIKITSYKISPENVKKWYYIFSKGKYEPLSELTEAMKQTESIKGGFGFSMECKDLNNDYDNNSYTIEVLPENSREFIPIPFKADLSDQETIKKLKILKRLILQTNCTFNISVLKTEKGLIVSNSYLDINFN